MRIQRRRPATVAFLWYRPRERRGGPIREPAQARQQPMVAGGVLQPALQPVVAAASNFTHASALDAGHRAPANLSELLDFKRDFAMLRAPTQGSLYRCDEVSFAESPIQSSKWGTWPDRFDAVTVAMRNVVIHHAKSNAPLTLVDEKALKRKDPRLDGLQYSFAEPTTVDRWQFCAFSAAMLSQDFHTDAISSGHCGRDSCKCSPPSYVGKRTVSKPTLNLATFDQYAHNMFDLLSNLHVLVQMRERFGVENVAVASVIDPTQESHSYMAEIFRALGLEKLEWIQPTDGVRFERLISPISAARIYCKLSVNALWSYRHVTALAPPRDLHPRVDILIGRRNVGVGSSRVLTNWNDLRAKLPAFKVAYFEDLKLHQRWALLKSCRTLAMEWGSGIANFMHAHPGLRVVLMHKPKSNGLDFIGQFATQLGHTISFIQGSNQDASEKPSSSSMTPWKLNDVTAAAAHILGSDSHDAMINMIS